MRELLLDKHQPHTRQIDAITGLRAAAVLLVFAVHTYPGLLPGGFIGVDMFFVISGFLITSILLREIDRTGTISLASFYIRRALRILPASLFCTLAVYAAARHLLQINGESAELNAAASALSFMNWLRAFTPATGGALGHFWSLAIEEQFYAIWSLLVLAMAFCGQKKRIPHAAAALLVVSIVWRSYLGLTGVEADRIYNGLDTHADGLLIGCILAAFASSAAVRFLSRFWWIAVGAACVETALFDADSTMLWLYIPIVSLTAGWIVAAALNPGTPLSKRLAAAPALALGRRSYSFYLWHLPIISAFFASGMSRSVWIIPSFVLCLVAADVSYRLIEKPFLRFKDWRLGPIQRA